MGQVKATLKSERAKVPRRRFSSRQRTSRFMGVGSSNRKNQWQARILVHGKVRRSVLRSQPHLQRMLAFGRLVGLCRVLLGELRIKGGCSGVSYTAARQCRHPSGRSIHASCAFPCSSTCEGSLTVLPDLATWKHVHLPELQGGTRESQSARILYLQHLSAARSHPGTVAVLLPGKPETALARVLCARQVTHLGYYETEEEAARVYDRVSISLHGPHAQTNYPAAEYEGQECGEFQGLAREELQRALGVKPMDKSSRCVSFCAVGHILSVCTACCHSAVSLLSACLSMKATSSCPAMMLTLD